MIDAGIYVHVPYCRRKCLYCDFFSGGYKTADWEGFVRCIINEYNERRGEMSGKADTLYIGGGTPSLMPDTPFRSLLRFLIDNISWGIDKREISLEVNPEDVSEEKARMWKGEGVNRVSMGVQSFNNDELIRVGRRHDSRRAMETYDVLRKHFDNISIDLMFGLPGQTVESWEKSVETAVTLNPDHISAYSLMLEEGTPMTVLAEKGRIELPDDRLNDEMWRRLSVRLSESGYRQYEISNYSKQGYESKHNGKYWRQVPYLGLGPSAHSYDGDRERRFNPPDITGYLKRFGSGQERREPFYRREILTDEEIKEEYILTRMRVSEGINLSDFRERFGKAAEERLLHNLMTLPNQELVENKEGNISLSSDGIMVADSVILALAM